MEKLLLIIPAYNEEDSLESTIQTIESFKKSNNLDFLLDYIVINDGSTDRTAIIAQKLKVPLIDLEVNLGLTGAFMAGMQYAQKNDYDFALQFDADGQHLPEYIPEMIAASQRGVNIVVGSRFISEKRKINSFRMLGNALISLAIKITTTQILNDPTSGMRLFDRKAIQFYISRSNSTPEADTISFMLKKGFVVKEVQVKMPDRTAGNSYLTLSKSIHFMISRLFSILFIQPFRR